MFSRQRESKRFRGHEDAECSAHHHHRIQLMTNEHLRKRPTDHGVSWGAIITRWWVSVARIIRVLYNAYIHFSQLRLVLMFVPLFHLIYRRLKPRNPLSSLSSTAPSPWTIRFSMSPCLRSTFTTKSKLVERLLPSRETMLWSPETEQSWPSQALPNLNSASVNWNTFLNATWRSNNFETTFVLLPPARTLTKCDTFQSAEVTTLTKSKAPFLGLNLNLCLAPPYFFYR